MSEQLGISWHDSTWIPHLNPTNILDYFCQKSNPFYDSNCNNEEAKMQRLPPEQMTIMQGVQYTLLHVQEPILYVIRKQHRISPEIATPLVDFYILAGIVYQAPDLNSIIQSRVLNSALNLKTALEEFHAISTFNPSIGHSWRHQQEIPKPKLTSKAKNMERPTQGPKEYTRFQVKVNSLMKSFSENS